MLKQVVNQLMVEFESVGFCVSAPVQNALKELVLDEKSEAFENWILGLLLVRGVQKLYQRRRCAHYFRGETEALENLR